MKCPVCKKEAKHECPVCKKKFCEEHVFPENHKKYCKHNINIKTPLKQMGALLVVLAIIAVVVFIVGNEDAVGGIMPAINRLFEKTPAQPDLVMNTTLSPINETPVPPKASSFSDYLMNESYLGKVVTLKGRLSSVPVKDGYFSYVNDDYGNKLLLSLQNNEQRKIFTSLDNSRIYEVTGTFKKKYDGYYIVVSSIS